MSKLKVIVVFYELDSSKHSKSYVYKIRIYGQFFYSLIL